VIVNAAAKISDTRTIKEVMLLTIYFLLFLHEHKGIIVDITVEMHIGSGETKPSVTCMRLARADRGHDDAKYVDKKSIDATSSRGLERG